MQPRLAAFALAMLLAACAGQEDKAVRDDPNFQAGYADGCSAATTQSSNYREEPKRDEELYKNDEAYRRGWGSGMTTCRRTLVPPNRTGGSVIADPNPGH